MENNSKWIRSKDRDAVVKNEMEHMENGTLQVLTEEKWNNQVSRLAKLAMVPYNRNDLLKLVKFLFNLRNF
jgi:hypothetical protein